MHKMQRLHKKWHLHLKLEGIELKIKQIEREDPKTAKNKYSDVF